MEVIPVSEGLERAFSGQTWASTSRVPAEGLLSPAFSPRLDVSSVPSTPSKAINRRTSAPFFDVLWYTLCAGSQDAPKYLVSCGTASMPMLAGARRKLLGDAEWSGWEGDSFEVRTVTMMGPRSSNGSCPGRLASYGLLISVWILAVPLCTETHHPVWACGCRCQMAAAGCGTPG